MLPLLKRIQNIIGSSSLLQNDSVVVLGVSGGSDSVALLHILSELFPSTKRIAVYVDHGLRPNETPTEKTLVQKLADRCSASFEYVAVDVRDKMKKEDCSLEEAARILRYQALEKVCLKHQGNAIAVGHTANDQAEEVLLRLIRGTGVTGLSGMNLQHGKVIRPLLKETKDTLRSYLQEHHIPFCQDSSNDNTRFLRNRIRLQLLPILEHDYNASIQQTLTQTAEILSDEDTLLAELTNTILPKLTTIEPEKITLSTQPFTKQPIAIQRRILDTICWKLDSKPSFVKIQSLLKLATTTEQKEVHLSAGLRAVTFNNSILFHRPSKAKGYRGSGYIPNTFSPLTLLEPGTYQLRELNSTLILRRIPFVPNMPHSPDEQLMDAEKLCFPLLLRQYKKGETFYPLGAPGKKKISRFLSDQKIPAIERHRYPLLVSNNRPIAIVGLRVDHRVKVTKSTKYVLILRFSSY